ncbi:YbhB/YbcL family Raf kinase inhibitor-like protein [Patescibacteria group bacterium]|nr:YbhB/YbcL family Raf kinase inhibitor-like protein [Patescibacteria group bacterium]MBU1952273.1 YbhB/YbcL family Raf kinase inhibitor-like protein [Patescibacteria group bacterium]
MEISSSEFLNNGMMPSKYTCDGENISPPLRVSEIPTSAKSLAIINDDPDAPAGDWVHWVVWNIDPDTMDIVENCVMEGAVEGKNDFGDNGYGGPCPPSGTHRYFFKVYALDSRIDLDKSHGKKELEEAIKGHVLEQAHLIGLYALQ